MKDEDWDTVLTVNLESYFRLVARGAARHDEAPLGPDHRHHLGGGVTGNPGQANYAASKAGMIGITKALAAGGRQPQHHRQLRRARASSRAR